MTEIPVWIIFFGAASSIFSILAASLIYWHYRKTIRNQKNDLIWQTFREIDAVSDDDSILTLLDIEEEDVVKLGLSKKQIKTFVLVTEVIWRRLMDNKGFGRIRNAIAQSKTMEESVDIILLNNWELTDIGYTGRITMSEGFAKAWPIIQKIWPTDPNNFAAAYIEAGIKRGQLRRNKGKNQ